MSALIWIDLEATGLDPSLCTILEMAVAVARFDDPFNISHVFSEIRYWKPHPGYAEVHPVPFKMHTDSGLLAECALSVNRLATLGELLDVTIGRCSEGNERPILAGSSVHFDMAFLRTHFPTQAAKLHYRLFDVTAMGLLAQSMGMDVDAVAKPHAVAHRAKNDIENSVAYGLAVRGWLRDSSKVRELEAEVARLEDALDGAWQAAMGEDL